MTPPERHRGGYPAPARGQMPNWRNVEELRVSLQHLGATWRHAKHGILWTLPNGRTIMISHKALSGRQWKNVRAEARRVMAPYFPTQEALSMDIQLPPALNDGPRQLPVHVVSPALEVLIAPLPAPEPVIEVPETDSLTVAAARIALVLCRQGDGTFEYADLRRRLRAARPGISKAQATGGVSKFVSIGLKHELLSLVGPTVQRQFRGELRQRYIGLPKWVLSDDPLSYVVTGTQLITVDAIDDVANAASELVSKNKMLNMSVARILVALGRRKLRWFTVDGISSLLRRVPMWMVHAVVDRCIDNSLLRRNPDRPGEIRKTHLWSPGAAVVVCVNWTPPHPAAAAARPAPVIIETQATPVEVECGLPDVHALLAEAEAIRDAGEVGALRRALGAVTAERDQALAERDEDRQALAEVQGKMEQITAERDRAQGEIVALRAQVATQEGTLRRLAQAHADIKTQLGVR